jgi:hypothetical protein
MGENFQKLILCLNYLFKKLVTIIFTIYYVFSYNSQMSYNVLLFTVAEFHF